MLYYCHGRCLAEASATGPFRLADCFRAISAERRPRPSPEVDLDPCITGHNCEGMARGLLLSLLDQTLGSTALGCDSPHHTRELARFRTMHDVDVQLAPCDLLHSSC